MAALLGISVYSSNATNPKNCQLREVFVSSPIILQIHEYCMHNLRKYIRVYILLLHPVSD